MYQKGFDSYRFWIWFKFYRLLFFCILYFVFAFVFGICFCFQFSVISFVSILQFCFCFSSAISLVEFLKILIVVVVVVVLQKEKTKRRLYLNATKDIKKICLNTHTCTHRILDSWAVLHTYVNLINRKKITVCVWANSKGICPSLSLASSSRGIGFSVFCLSLRAAVKNVIS